MANTTYSELRQHIGHKIVCVCYGKKGKDPENVAIECETCNEVLLDYDRESEGQIFCANCGELVTEPDLVEVTVADTGAKFDLFLCGNCKNNDYGEAN